MQYNCLFCSDKSPIPICEQCAREERMLSNARRIPALPEAMAEVGVPSVLIGARLTPEHDKLLLGSDKPMKLLFGPTGVGKSYIAAALVAKRLIRLIELIHPRISDWWSGTRFIRSSELLEELRPTETESVYTLHDFCQIPFLVIDDFGSEKASEWVGQQWHTLLDRRTGKETIITTNFNNRDIESMYGAWGAPIVSRLSAFDIIKMSGEDKRRKK